MSINVKIFYGPTASGKTSAALDYAARNECVIINADAMQCYKDLPILTAQPTLQEQACAPHVLYGFLDASEDMIVTKWCHLAIKEIENAALENRQPVLVGGTGMYLKALMHGLSNIPDIPSDVRQNAIEIYETYGLSPLLDDLKSYHPEILEKLDYRNSRRVIRAWEVLKHTGRSLLEWQEDNTPQAPENLNFQIEFITRERTELVARINSRFDQMMKQNVLEEVKLLSNRIDMGEVNEANLIIKAHGFRPLRAYLKGETPLDEAIEQSKIETRQYAKRQMTWARHQFGLNTES